MLCTPIVYISIQIIFTQKALGKVARASCMHFVSRDFFTVRDHQINKHGGAERTPKTEENGPFKRKRKEEKEKRTDKNGQFNKNISRICLSALESSHGGEKPKKWQWIGDILARWVSWKFNCCLVESEVDWRQTVRHSGVNSHCQRWSSLKSQLLICCRM